MGINDNKDIENDYKQTKNNQKVTKNKQACRLIILCLFQSLGVLLYLWGVELLNVCVQGPIVS